MTNKPIKIKPIKIKLGTIHCPDWMDRPLGLFIRVIVPTFWILFVIGLAITYSPWWLFLLLLMPTGLVKFGEKGLKHQKDKAKRLEEWKESLKEETKK